MCGVRRARATRGSLRPAWPLSRCWSCWSLALALALAVALALAHGAVAERHQHQHQQGQQYHHHPQQRQRQRQLQQASPAQQQQAAPAPGGGARTPAPAALSAHTLLGAPHDARLPAALYAAKAAEDVASRAAEAGAARGGWEVGRGARLAAARRGAPCSSLSGPGCLADSGFALAVRRERADVETGEALKRNRLDARAGGTRGGAGGPSLTGVLDLLGFFSAPETSKGASGEGASDGAGSAGRRASRQQAGAPKARGTGDAGSGERARQEADKIAGAGGDGD